MQSGLVEVPSSEVPGVNIRKFGAAEISKAIDEATAAIPAGKTAAAVAFVDPLSGKAKVAAMAKIGSQWSVMLYAGYDWKGKKPEAGAAVRWAI